MVSDAGRGATQYLEQTVVYAETPDWYARLVDLAMPSACNLARPVVNSGLAWQVWGLGLPLLVVPVS